MLIKVFSFKVLFYSLFFPLMFQVGEKWSENEPSLLHQPALPHHCSRNDVRCVVDYSIQDTKIEHLDVFIEMFLLFYRVYQGFRLNLGKISEMNILVSLLITFKVINICRVGLVITWNWLKPEAKPEWPSYVCPNPWYTRYHFFVSLYHFHSLSYTLF